MGHVTVAAGRAAGLAEVAVAERAGQVMVASAGSKSEGNPWWHGGWCSKSRGSVAAGCWRSSGRDEAGYAAAAPAERMVHSATMPTAGHTTAAARTSGGSNHDESEKVTACAERGNSSGIDERAMDVYGHCH
jgi:hypothetical protein